MIILLTGAAGQLGQELTPCLQQLGDLVAVDRAPLPGAEQMYIQDLGDAGSVESLLDRVRPDLVVNAAAYTAVDLAEDDRETAFRVNEGLPDCLARWCHHNDGLLLHYSTDYVFDGTATQPYKENDPTGPLGVYGQSKLAGERAIERSGCRHVILRTSWVYSGQGNNFVLTMLKLARTRASLNIVHDQVGRPTWARNLAQVSRKIIGQLITGGDERQSLGIFNYCDRDAVTWYEFANRIFTVADEAGLLADIPSTAPVTTAEFPQKAQRPQFSVLDTSCIQDQFGIKPAGLKESLQSCLKEITQNDG
jgi:dTDP-4-dehydrorhamnose reductase